GGRAPRAEGSLLPRSKSAVPANFSAVPSAAAIFAKTLKLQEFSQEKLRRMRLVWQIPLFLPLLPADPAGWISPSARPTAVRPAHSSMIATARVQPAEARSIFAGKQLTMNPVEGSASRLCNFS